MLSVTPRSAESQKDVMKLVQRIHRVLRSGLWEQLYMNPVIFRQRVFWTQTLSSLDMAKIDI